MKKTSVITGLLFLGLSLLIAGCGKSGKNKALESGEVPHELSDTLKVKRLSKSYVISGIGHKGTNAVAIINNQLVVPGDVLDPGVVLKSISSTYATISVDNQGYLIRPESIQNKLNQK